MRFRFHPQLPVQLVLATLLPIMLVSGAISVPMMGVQRAQLLEQAQLRAQLAGRTAESIYADRLAFATLLASLLADRPVLTDSISSSNRAAVQEFVEQTRTDTLFDLVTVVDQTGAVLAQDGAAGLWQPQHAGDAGLSFWGVPKVGLVVQVAHPIRQSGQQLGHLLGSFVIGDVLLAAMRGQTNLEQSILFGGQLLATSHPERTALLGSFVETPESGAVPTDVALTVETSINGRPYLAYYTPLQSLDARVVGTVEVLLPLEPVHAAQRAATVTLFVITLLTALTATALGWLLARRYTSPVRQLARVAEGIAGDLTRPVMVRGPLEIQMLSQSIEHMRRQLHDTHSALQAEKARYASILESVEEGVITLDLGECITSMNRSAELLLGIDRAAAHSQPLGRVVMLRQEQALTLMHIPPIGAIPLAIHTHDGRAVTVAVTRSQIHALSDNSAGEHIVVLRDISEEVAVGQLKEAFLANVTHEFRTPLAALIASLEILREDSESLTDTERQHMLTAIHLGVQRLDTLVQNLLDSASLQAGYFRVDPDVTQLKPLIEEAVDVMRPLAEQRDQTLAVTFPADMPPIIADDRRVVQVLINLLSNASKFGPRGDTLAITVHVEPTEVCVGVTDHGPGIATNRQIRLFERFMRPGAETVRAQGIGLGLAIVKAIVERQAGRIIVSSDEVDGTTFLFTLPRAADERLAQADII
jgi:PAS domain S-box-containing protein